MKLPDVGHPAHLSEDEAIAKMGRPASAFGGVLRACTMGWFPGRLKLFPKIQNYTQSGGPAL